jgi:lipopolysaccharide export system permease protein
LGLFLKIMLVCYSSLAGLYLIIDVFNNLDEFVELGKRGGSLVGVLSAYYAPRLVGLFCEVSGLLYLLAAICTLTRLQATNELAAVQAAGVSVRRVTRPILLLTAVLCTLTWGAREVLLPKYREILSVNPQEMLRGQPLPVVSQIDYDSLIMFRGQEIDLSSRTIHGIDLQLPRDLQPSPGTGQAIADGTGAAMLARPMDRAMDRPGDRPVGGGGEQLKAKLAVWQPASEQHPGGFLLEGVELPETWVGAASVVQNGEPRVLLPSDQSWLGADQCFVPTHLSLWQLARGAAWFRSASLAELVAINRSGSVRLPAAHRVEMHWRLLRPWMDFLLLLIGLPLVLRSGGQKLVVAAGYCALLMLGVQLLIMAAQFLGGQQILKPAAFAAWLPLLVSLPIAVWSYQRFNY